MRSGGKSQWLAGTFEDSELPTNKTQMRVRTHTETHVDMFLISLFSKMMIFCPALCEVQTTTPAAVGRICLPSSSRKFY